MMAIPGATRPDAVGVLAIEVYFPRLMVHQEDLECADGVPGKYTVGLGQQEMAVPAECEDVVSMALSACSQLIETHGIHPLSIGRLEVGSESGLDRSKSIKSYLAQLFSSYGNSSLQGVDCVHGCYGATAALLNSVAWVQSSLWDGRLALVVASDVALYAPDSPARATGGAGAVALLVGPDAPLALDPPWLATVSGHSFDFTKPAGGASAPFPQVDGPAGVALYLATLEECAAQLRGRLQQAQQAGAGAAASAQAAPGQQQQQQQQGAAAPCQQEPPGVGPKEGRQQAAQGCAAGPSGPCLLLPQVGAFIAHAPFHRLVRKALARLLLADAMTAGRPQVEQQLLPGIDLVWAAQQYQYQHQQHQQQPGATAAATASGQLDQRLLAATGAQFERLSGDGCWLQQRLGNLYCGSLAAGLAAMVERRGPQLEGQRLLLFSFGSGVMASLLCLVGRRPAAGSGGGGGIVAGDAGSVDGGSGSAGCSWRSHKLSLAALQSRSSLAARLDKRKRVGVQRYQQLADRAAQTLAGQGLAGAAAAGAGTGASEPELWPGAWRLVHVDEQLRRHYARWMGSGADEG